jgi:hypothetical protein
VYPSPPRTSSASRSASDTSQYVLGLQFNNSTIAPDPTPTPARTPPRPHPPPNPDFLIVGLFALRLAYKIILDLDPYRERIDDLDWLANFLAHYHPSYDLAKLTGARKTVYLTHYPDIVGRMKSHPRYPIRFNQMNPVTPQRREEVQRRGGMTDGKCKIHATVLSRSDFSCPVDRIEIINFVDAAGEWKSNVLVPQSEMDRMAWLANQRRVADEDEGRVDVGVRHPHARDGLPSVEDIQNGPARYHV